MLDSFSIGDVLENRSAGEPFLIAAPASIAKPDQQTTEGS
jgi:hypothetical protein